MKRGLLFLAALAACPHGGGTPAATPAAPRLVVLLIIDQLPEWTFEAKRPELHGGFDRILGEGEWHVGRHPSAATLTAPGHALLGSGEPPAHSGVLANEWWHRDIGKMLKAVEGEDGTTTAKWMRVPGLGDAIAAARTGGKAVGVSLKDRAAILPLGHDGVSVWYDAKTAQWTVNAARSWVADWNRSHPVSAHLHDVWTPLDTGKLAKLTGIADDAPGEIGEKGFGPTFPHDLAKTRDPADAVFAAPIGNDLVLDTATAAIAGEGLGADATPDLLVISLSAHDYVGHGWGHESWEAWDLVMRLDQRLGVFLQDLDRTVGANRWAMIVTSDHGASPMPERLGGGRLTHHQIQVAANDAASAVLGAGDWIDNAHYPNVFFSKAALAQPAAELESATKRVINALRAFPGIERVDRVASFAGHCETRTGDDLTLCLTFDPERSGDLFYLPARGWIMQDEDEPLATAHGSMHDYDLLVPVILLPPGRKRHAPHTGPVPGEIAMVRIAPILARWLGVTAPINVTQH
jgi:hypothetical protein